jgi:hypothetical protein
MVEAYVRAGGGASGLFALRKQPKRADPGKRMLLSRPLDEGGPELFR